MTAKPARPIGLLLPQPAMPISRLLIVIALWLGATPWFAAADDKLSPVEAAERVDRFIDQKLADQKLQPSESADDAEFLRRVSLDVTGVIPALDEVTAFLASTDPLKRSRKIDELLQSEAYVRHMTDIWRELLIPTTAASTRREHDYMIRWIESSLRESKPWNRFASELIGAQGMQDENGATTFYITHESLDEVTDRVARVLLGVSIQCAQCHNHPFNDWKQDDYWGLAAFFAGVKQVYKRENSVERYGIGPEGSRAKFITPPSQKVLPAKFLLGESPQLEKDTSAVPLLADWLADENNPFLARSITNRVWHQLFARGLVEPLDDLRAANPATHPEVFDLLVEQFKRHNFDLRYLIRAICHTRAYQRTSRPNKSNANDIQYYSHMAIKVMQPYPLYSSLQRISALGEATPPPVTPEPTDPREAIKHRKRLRGTRDNFAGYFKGEEGAAPTSYQTGLPQALRLMNSQDMTTRVSKAVGQLLNRHNRDTEAVIEQLYLASLGRQPADNERLLAIEHIKRQKDATAGLNDLLWVLLNSAEFVANH